MPIVVLQVTKVVSKSSTLACTCTHPTENSIFPVTMLPSASCTGQNLPHRDRLHRNRGTKTPVSVKERSAQQQQQQKYEYHTVCTDVLREMTY